MIRLFVLFAVALLFVSCGKSNTPQPPPIAFSGGPISGPWIVTQGSSPGAPMGAFLQCASASACWISYADMMLSATFNGAQTFALGYTISGNSPTFVHDSPNNIPDGPSTLRLLLEGAGYRLFSVAIQPLQLGAGSLAVGLAPANWTMVDIAGNTITDPAIFANVISHVNSAGFCFGGGYFACHGVAVSGGSAAFTVNSAVIQ